MKKESPQKLSFFFEIGPFDCGYYEKNPVIPMS
jgi:hypothetical protein